MQGRGADLSLFGLLVNRVMQPACLLMFLIKS